MFKSYKVYKEVISLYQPADWSYTWRSKVLEFIALHRQINDYHRYGFHNLYKIYGCMTVLRFFLLIKIYFAVNKGFIYIYWVLLLIQAFPIQYHQEHWGNRLMFSVFYCIDICVNFLIIILYFKK